MTESWEDCDIQGDSRRKVRQSLGKLCHDSRILIRHVQHIPAIFRLREQPRLHLGIAEIGLIQLTLIQLKGGCANRACSVTGN